MARNMYKWVDEIIASKSKKALPVLSFPAIQKMGIAMQALLLRREMHALLPPESSWDPPARMPNKLLCSCAVALSKVGFDPRNRHAREPWCLAGVLKLSCRCLWTRTCVSVEL